MYDAPLNPRSLGNGSGMSVAVLMEFLWYLWHQFCENRSIFGRFTGMAHPHNRFQPHVSPTTTISHQFEPGMCAVKATVPQRFEPRTKSSIPSNRFEPRAPTAKATFRHAVVPGTVKATLLNTTESMTSVRPSPFKPRMSIAPQNLFEPRISPETMHRPNPFQPRTPSEKATQLNNTDRDVSAVKVTQPNTLESATIRRPNPFEPRTSMTEVALPNLPHPKTSTRNGTLSNPLEPRTSMMKSGHPNPFQPRISTAHIDRPNWPEYTLLVTSRNSRKNPFEPVAVAADDITPEASTHSGQFNHFMSEAAAKPPTFTAKTGSLNPFRPRALENSTGIPTSRQGQTNRFAPAASATIGANRQATRGRKTVYVQIPEPSLGARIATA